MFQATRRRLAIWYTTVTAVLLLVFATGVYLYVRSTLIERVDDTLNHVIEVVQRNLVIEAVPQGQFRVNVEASFPNNPGTVEDDHIDLEWFNPTGKLLWSTLSEPLNITIHLNRTGETVKVDRSRQGDSGVFLRQVTQRVQIGRQVLGYLRVSHPWFEVAKPTRLLILDLSLGTVLMIISVAAIGWWLSGLAMEPVRESYQRLKQFTADASHELRNPIATIQTNVQVALADPDLDGNEAIAPLHYRQQLKVIERLTQRLGRLVDDLLFLARQDSSMVQPSWVSVPLDALLIEAIEEQQLLAAEKGIALDLNLIDLHSDNWELKTEEHIAETRSIASGTGEQHDRRSRADLKSEEDAFTVCGDWNQLARLFTNLIGNALQYTQKGGRVEVELQRLERYGTLGTLLASSILLVRVRDTGTGIPSEALPHIFDRFYRADPARTHVETAATATGSGLGLAIARAIVENHHGCIQVESILHQGTTFTVTLPGLKQETPG